MFLHAGGGFCVEVYAGASCAVGGIPIPIPVLINVPITSTGTTAPITLTVSLNLLDLNSPPCVMINVGNDPICSNN